MDDAVRLFRAVVLAIQHAFNWGVLHSGRAWAVLQHDNLANQIIAAIFLVAVVIFLVALVFTLIRLFEVALYQVFGMLGSILVILVCLALLPRL